MPLIGFANRISNVLGIAPIYGPKNGITLVTPTITLTNIVYGIFKNDSPIKQSTPIIAESIILPIRNPPNISLAFCVICSTTLA